MEMKEKKNFKVLFMAIGIIVLGVIGFLIWNKMKKPVTHPSLTFIGHASVKIKSKEGDVVYIDPYYPEGDYNEAADYILVTHDHSDHNVISLCNQKESCQVITWSDALKDGEYMSYENESGTIKIEAVPSGGNPNHTVKSCVGYIVTVDGISVYHAGDTSMSEEKKLIAEKHIDYAMYPIDGVYNMGPEEATEVANLVGATYNIPIHGNDGKLKEDSERFTPEGKMSLAESEMIFLEK